MEGPTPVSSIVHSATMVAAGVYLSARIYPILTPTAQLVVATLGLVTLVMAACMALVMTDIKRVLAYSTISQLGYMILGIGSGAWAFARFHLITHAFFKCCLFQCSGSVIEAAHHEQDMRQYGGLARKMPVTAACYGLSTLAIAGASIPWTSLGMSGFYSKDGIIAGTVNYGEALAESGFGPLGHLFWIAPLAVAYVTVFYMARSFALTFLGTPRNQELHEHAHEVNWTMTVPQSLLALLATIAAMLPFLTLIEAAEPAGEIVQNATQLHGSKHAMHVTHAWLLHGLGWILALAAGILLYRPGLVYADRIAALPGFNLLHRWFREKFYFDALYDTFAVALGKAIAAVAAWIDRHLVDGLVNGAACLARTGARASGAFDRRFVDGLVNGTAEFALQGGRVLRSSQPGRIRAYVLVMLVAVLLASLLTVTVVLVIT